MARVVIAPDSFKGTMSAQEVCDIISSAVLEHTPGTEICCIPMSDGGEGMVSSYLSLVGGQAYSARVTGPEWTAVDCPYGILSDGAAVAEMAGCAGIMLMENGLDPFNATTYGVGELFLKLRDMGCDRLLLGIGGSATNDCGIGMAAALGYRFLDEEGNALEPRTKNIKLIRSIARPENELDLKITVACDVNNPLCGKNGATAIFGPQKGVKPEEIETLDASIRRLADIIKRDLGCDVADIPSAGAAGGLGAALVAFCGAELKPGIELILDSAGFDALAKNADLVITGEGRLDGQSMAGKVPVGISRRAKKAGTECIAICGCLGKGAEAVLAEGISAYYPCSDGSESFEEIKKNCRESLYRTALEAVRIHLR